MRSFFLITPILILAVFASTVQSADTAVSEFPEDNIFQKEVVPFLAKNCLSCHSDEDRMADLSLAKYKDDLSLQKDRRVWENVISLLRKHEMPPIDEPQPNIDERTAVIESIEDILASLDCGKPGHVPNAGRVTIRRLNRTEYNNTIRDLVGIDFKPAADFPADDVGYGFDNIGDVLSFSPLLAERYLIAAESILEEAIVVMDPPQETSSRVGQLRPTSATASVEQSGFITLEEGDYVITAKVYAEQAGSDPAKAKMRILFQANDQLIESDEVEIRGFKNDPNEIEMAFRAQKGSYRIGVLFLNPHDEFPPDAEAATNDEIAKLIEIKQKAEVAAIFRGDQGELNEQERQRVRDARRAARDTAESTAESLRALGVKTRALYVANINTVGPTNPPEPTRPESHVRLMKHALGVDARSAATEIITRFASKAFRRPAKPNEIADCLMLYDRATQRGDRFELAIRSALLRVLVSPHFLYRIEYDPADIKPGEIYAIAEYELASRLSYFLWNSMPDDELLSLAAENRLRSELDEQVKRMLRDEKANSFVMNFAEQWLALRKLDISSPDPTLFPAFTPELRESMMQESLLFFAEIVRDDHSILDLITADFTYVNEPLAKLYGVPNVKGDRFVRIAAPAHRGGVLTQASILTLTSNATRTAPVKRGKFVLDQILNTPPPPPPADVPPLEEEKILTGSLRQVMEQHRDNAMCASCHSKMDPLGFAFENFDAIGQWRDKDGDFVVDASGVLPSGQNFNGPDELKEIMRTEKDLFVRCVTEKMLTYALGRGLEYYDKCCIDNLIVAMEQNDFKFSTLLTEIIKSEPFQMRTASAPSEPSRLPENGDL